MKKPLLTLCLLLLVGAGCQGDSPETNQESDATDSRGGSERREPERPERQDPSVIKTSEIVWILETGEIQFIATTHSQSIRIHLRDGTEYRGQYVHAQAGKYSEDEQLADILNLVTHIRRARPAEETKDWSILCE